MKFKKMILIDENDTEMEFEIKFQSTLNIHFGINRSNNGMIQKMSHNGNEVISFISAPPHLLDIYNDELGKLIKETVDTGFPY